MEALILQAFEDISTDLWQAECEQVKHIENQYTEQEDISTDLWQAECEQVKHIENQYTEQDILHDDTDEFIIRLGESDSEMEWTDSENEL
ncbi:hypothetical protein QE152_g15685 [Popillia japonica]|uniref:Uncharacterized protein n=1 Tax=Popillia japonica TaxID=7064 RepID=A0AAW1L7S2_POPJA